MARVIVGHEDSIEEIFIALVCGGHCLLEGVPGLGKTLMVRSLGEILSLSFSRIQFTPDLMPADITGTNMLTDDPIGAESLRVSARAGIRPHRPGRRNQSRHAQDPVRVARSDAGADASRSAARCTGWNIRSWSWRRKIQSKWKAPTRCPKRRWTVFFSSFCWSFRAARTWPHRRPDHRCARLGRCAKCRCGRDFTDASMGQGSTVGRSGEGLCGADCARAPIRNKDRETVRRGLAQRFVLYGSSPRGLQSLILAAKARALLAGRPNVSFDDIRTQLAAEFAPSADSQSRSRCGRRYGGKDFNRGGSASAGSGIVDESGAWRFEFRITCRANR